MKRSTWTESTWFHLSSSLGLLILIVELFPLGTGLSCYRCLNLDCPSEPEVCEEVRNFITDQLRGYYYIDELLPTCPDPKDSLQWKLMQITSNPCEYQRAEQATCALSRLQIITETSADSSFTTFGTVMGCARLPLLMAIRQNIANFRADKCAVIAQNVTLEQKLLKFNYEIETCHQSTEYCNKEDFCVAPLQSIIRPFKQQKYDRSFELGTVIGIIALILVIVFAVILASMCKSPLNWASNTYHVTNGQSILES